MNEQQPALAIPFTGGTSADAILIAGGALAVLTLVLLLVRARARRIA